MDGYGFTYFWSMDMDGYGFYKPRPCQSLALTLALVGELDGPSRFLSDKLT